MAVENRLNYFKYVQAAVVSGIQPASIAAELSRIEEVADTKTRTAEIMNCIESGDLFISQIQWQLLSARLNLARRVHA